MHLGATGAGAAMKVVVNAVIAVINEAIAEGLVLAERAGIARETRTTSSPRRRRRGAVRPLQAGCVPPSRRGSVAFTIELMRKDLRLVFALADELGVDPLAVRAADETLARASDLGMAERDFSSVAELLRTA